MALRSADKDRFKSISEMDKPGIKIAYNMGGLNETFAKSMFKQATPTAFDSNALATAALLDGSVDAQVADSTAALYMARQDARIAVMDPANIFNPVYVAILLHREDQTLLNYPLCRFSDAGNTDLTTRSGERRPKTCTDAEAAFGREVSWRSPVDGSQTRICRYRICTEGGAISPLSHEAAVFTDSSAR